MSIVELPNSLIKRRCNKSPPRRKALQKVAQKTKERKRPARNTTNPYSTFNRGHHQNPSSGSPRWCLEGGKRCLRHRRHPIWPCLILGFHLEISRYLVGRTNDSTTLPPTRKTTPEGAITAGNDRVDTRFSSGVGPSTNNPGIRGHQRQVGAQDQANTTRNEMVEAGRRKLREHAPTWLVRTAARMAWARQAGSGQLRPPCAELGNPPHRSAHESSKESQT